MKKYQTGMLFGVFDGFHPGHQFLISEAQKLAEKLFITVAQDEVVFELKQKNPQFSIEERKKAIQHIFPEVLPVDGDKKRGNWTPIRTYNPEVIILGYDQEALKKQIEIDFPSLPIISLLPHKPEELHSSLLNK